MSDPNDIQRKIQEQIAAQLGGGVKVEMNKPNPKAGRFDLLDNKVAHKLGVGVSGTAGSGLRDRFSQLWHDTMNGDLWQDGEFMDDVRQATLRGAHPAARLLFYTLTTFLVIFLLWATIAPLDEISHAQGQVIPSGKVQAVGSPEGGVVEAIFVQAGQIVEPGQALVRLNNSTAAAGFGEKATRREYLQANIARLQAEVELTELTFPGDFAEKNPTLVAEVTKLYQNRKSELESTVKVLEEQLEQRRQELTDARRKTASFGQALGLAQKEYDMTKPYLDSGAISKVDVLRLERAVVDARKDYNTAQTSIPAAEAAVREAEGKVEEGRLKFTNEARDELGKLTDEFNRLGQGIKAEENRVDQALLKSPIRAEVKQIMVNTIGQVVQPNTNIVELVPVNETLLIEAKVKPSDIAFVRPGLPAKIKITAYDFSIYGGLDGEVESVSADSFTDEAKQRRPGEPETYFKAQVRTNKNYLERYGQKYPIKSGMVAEADIITGRKTVMQYLLKPINKARADALTER
ncbi:MAG: HlyD family type I secretion periplasmic adaptor subunit [Blastochloris viridis]|uniref:Membrane fusion protein (MFP) family protein n=1 Tax=Blastochloris viridis TaxID=1079 RepID=A0A6N4RCZ4_BLAVI|nr:MAG: HlyD family type I secretion periplasmic adaptor subunit [Blastochloris viridis]